jgi:heme exporter protein B
MLYFCAMLSTTQQIIHLFRLYWALEGRSRQLLSGVLLYVVAIVLVTSYIFSSPDGETWLALFWVILLFASVNTGVLSFVQESGGRRWYYYQLAGPLAVYLAKAIHMFSLLLIVGMLTLGLMSIFYGFPVQNPFLLLYAALLSTSGLSLLFAFMSAIASQSGNAATLTTIIGFPLVIGLSMLAGKIARGSLMAGLTVTDLQWDFIMLIALNMMIGGMGILLFSYIWRD